MVFSDIQTKMDELDKLLKKQGIKVKLNARFELKDHILQYNWKLTEKKE